MKERPILFSAPMVRALLEGRKTQTRRIVKPLPKAHTSSLEFNSADQAFVPWDNRCAHSGVSYQRNGDPIKCPYGKPGERLWVRENFQKDVSGCPNGISYAADHVDPKGDGPAHPMRWRPSIHMPRFASRITLEIVSVRVKRLNTLTHVDAKAEGVEPAPHRAPQGDRCDGDSSGAGDCYRCAFKFLWNKLNGPRGFGWDANPWVWVMEFKRVPNA